MDFIDDLKIKFGRFFEYTLKETEGTISKKNAIRIFDILVDDLIEEAAGRIIKNDPNLNENDLETKIAEIKEILAEYKNELISNIKELSPENNQSGDKTG